MNKKNLMSEIEELEIQPLEDAVLKSVTGGCGCPTCSCSKTYGACSSFDGLSAAPAVAEKEAPTACDAG